MLLSCLLAGQVLTGLSLLYGTSALAAEANGQQVLSTWMWNPYVIGQEADSTLQQLTSKGVNRVYLLVDSSYPVSYYSSFIRKANAQHIEIQALGGAPNWVLPEYNKRMYAFIDWVKSYNGSVLPEERFAGIHLDVEPYVLPEWRKDSDTVIGLWKDTVSGFVEEVKSDSTLTVGMDMPVWLDSFQVGDGQGGRTTLSDWLIRRMDEVTLMAYFNKAQDIASSVQTELAEADQAGVPVLVAVDTVDSGEPGTFYGKSEALMMQELSALLEQIGGRPSFGGIGVHEWDSWLKMN
ncbi:hypothetical protein [Paenibacillus sp. 32352]|uniref:hypothetical protein n=1 Tax=Paenibacillus sp. 32352 TaxID=1969111 RepID=UPI0009AC0E8F|nr:hypothetical protein [Paenibacillus sp. 32352]